METAKTMRLSFGQIGCFTLILIMTLGIAAGSMANTYILVVLLAFPFFFAYREFRKQHAKNVELRAIRRQQRLAEQAQRAALERARLAAEQAHRELEWQRLAAQKTLSDPHKVVIGPAIDRTWNAQVAAFEVGLATYKFVALTPEHLTRHMVVVAPTRSGKTYNFIRPLIDFSRRLEAAAIFFDPKGNDFDPNDFDLNFSMQPAERSTTIKLCVLDPTQAATNPLQACRKLAEAVIPQATERYFSDAAREAMAAFMFSHFIVFGKMPELSQVLAYSANEQPRQQLANKLQLLLESAPAGSDGADRAEDALNLLNVAESRSKGRSDVLGSLYNSLLPLATGQFKKYLTTDPTQGVTVRQMLEGRLLCRIAFTSDEGEIGQALGKVVNQQYTDAVLSPNIDKSYLKLIVIDEAHNYICEALKKGTAQAAGNNAGYILAFQSLRQITDPDMRVVIRDNCKNKAVLAGVGYEDAADFSNFFGETEMPYFGYNMGSNQSQGQNQGVNQGQSQSYSDSSSGPGFTQTYSQGQNQGTSTGQGQSQGVSQSYQRRPIYLPGKLTNLPRYSAVVYLDDGGSSENESDPYPQMMRFYSPEEREQFECWQPPLPARPSPQLRPEQYLVLPAGARLKPTPKPIVEVDPKELEADRQALLQELEATSPSTSTSTSAGASPTSGTVPSHVSINSANSVNSVNNINHLNTEAQPGAVAAAPAPAPAVAPPPPLPGWMTLDGHQEPEQAGTNQDNNPD